MLGGLSTITVKLREILAVARIRRRLMLRQRQELAVEKYLNMNIRNPRTRLSITRRNYLWKISQKTT